MVKGNILSKAPCNSDLFEGNAHKKLATIIAGEIEEDSNCTIIGIDGGWGAGKSNLVGMIEKNLTNEDGTRPDLEGKYHFFTYDAWGHQNDLPRRSILEELTSDITSEKNGILNEQDWKLKLDNLLARKKRTSTKTVPSLNFAIVTIALMTALTPVISAISDKITAPEWKLIFTASVYFLAIAFIVCKQIRNMKKHGQNVNMESFFTELFLLYKDKIKEDEKFETVSEREPSTKQFKDWMDDINMSLKGKDKHLMIVIDNMDRLPKVKVQELWSAIHSFFSEKQYSNIRVIVPFDRLHIRNAFQSEDIKSGEETETSKTAVYGDDFINKTFYIVYHVAPPILSGWKQYFELQWKNAFGEAYPIDNAILQVYDLLTNEHSPRKIVAFINEFVTIKSVADENIPDRYIALFIFGRTAIAKDPITEILVPSYLSSLEFMYKDDKDMPGYISALYYQLPVGDAVDVVYTRQFTKELDENNPVNISLMKTSGIRKFNAILERAIADVTNTNNATLALNSVFAEKISSEISNFWECLYMKAKSTRGEIKVYIPYQKILLTHIKNKSFYVKELIRGYHHNFTEETDMKGYIDGIDALAEVEGVNLYPLLEKIKKEISPAQFIALVEDKEYNYMKYGITCTDSSLSEYLSNQQIEDWVRLQILPYLDRENYPLKSFKNKIEESLKENNLDVSNAEILFDKLKELRKDSTIQYNDYFTNDKLANLYNSASSDFKYDLIAMRLSALSNYSSSNNYFNSVLNSNNESDVSKVAKVSNNYVGYGTLLVALDTFDNPFVRELCKYHTIHSCGVQAMSIQSVIVKFKTILEHSDITATELLKRLNDWSKYKENISIDLVPSISLVVFETAKTKECELSTYLLDLATSYLQSISQEDWTTYLNEIDNKQLKLLSVHHTEKLQLFFDAFKSIMKKYATGESTDCLNADTVENIITISEDLHHDVKKLFMEIRDIFLTSTINSPKLKYFGNWLFKYANMTQKAGCLERILTSEILDDDVIVQMMCDHKEAVKGMMEHSTDTTEFVSKLESMLSGSRKDNSDFVELCKYLGISVAEESEGND